MSELNINECRLKLISEPIALLEYHKYMDEQKNDIDAFTKEDFPFDEWIEGFIDEYECYAYSVKMSHWKDDLQNKLVKGVF